MASETRTSLENWFVRTCHRHGADPFQAMVMVPYVTLPELTEAKRLYDNGMVLRDYSASEKALLGVVRAAIQHRKEKELHQ